MSILASASGAPTLLPIANKILRDYSRTFAAQYFYLDLGGSCALLESRIYPVFGPRWSASETVPLSACAST